MKKHGMRIRSYDLASCFMTAFNQRIKNSLTEGISVYGGSATVCDENEPTLQFLHYTDEKGRILFSPKKKASLCELTF